MGRSSQQLRSTWTSGVRSAIYMQLASYMEGGPLMWMMPLHLRVNKKTDYDTISQDLI